MALLYSHSFTRTVIQSIPQPFTKLRFIVLVTFTFLSHFVSTFMNCSEICVSNVYFSPRIKTSLRYSSMVLAVGCDFLRAERESQAKQRRGKNSLKAGPHKKHPHFVGKGAQKAASRSLTVALTVVTAAAAHSGRVLGQRRSLRPWFPTNPHKTRSKRNNPSPPKS